MGVPTLVHKYDIADFTNYYYWQVYFQNAGSWTIQGSEVTGVAGTILDLKVATRPIYISGGTGCYLLGDYIPYLGPHVYTGTTSNEYPVGTDYYYGNLGIKLENNI
jgi:hypothetical protein